MTTSTSKRLIIIAHSGLEKKITEQECMAVIDSSLYSEVFFIDFEISKAKLSELYDLPFEQLALEQQRKFKSDIEPLLLKNPDATIAYFGLVAIPLAFQLGVLFSSFPKYLLYQYHHENKIWYLNIEPIKGYTFELAEAELPLKTEKGKGDVFIRVGTSFRIEPQHTYEVSVNPTNEFDITLKTPHVDSISIEQEMIDIIDSFQRVLSAYANFLPDRDKLHLFIASTPGLSFALGTKINPNVFPFIQTYQYSKDEMPKYKEAILITKRADVITAYSNEEKEMAAKLRRSWNSELSEKVKPFIKSNEGVFESWFAEITQKKEELKDCIKSPWNDLPDLSKTSLLNDSIDTESNVVANGFKYIGSESKWQIDDGMFVSLNKRLSQYSNTDILRAGRLFLFHEGLHYSQDGHGLIEEIATGIGRFPKVIEEADYQADVWALLYEYRYSYTGQADVVSANLKKFFLDLIDTATETMWSFVDNGIELTEIQIRSMNRFLNWYWQWVRIERLPGTGTLKEIVMILFDKPTIEFAGAEIITIDKQRTCFKLSAKPFSNYELAIFHKNKVNRFSPAKISRIVEGFRELSGSKIKEGLRSFLVSLN
jgi:hypothetical protein